MNRLIALLLFVTLASLGQAVVVYDHITNNTSVTAIHFATEEDWGDDLTLSSTAPITALEFKVGIPGPFLPVTHTMRARVYDRVGLNPPSLLLGQATITETITASISILRFEMPNVQPLSTDVWVVLDTPGVSGLQAPHPFIGGTPSIGTSSSNILYSLNNGSWVVWDPSSINQIGNFSIRVEAVPEPGSLIALTLGGLALVRRRWR